MMRGLANVMIRDDQSRRSVWSVERLGGNRPHLWPAQWNCSSSVEPTNASVPLSGLRAVATLSKYPVPTSA